MSRVRTKPLSRKEKRPVKRSRPALAQCTFRCVGCENQSRARGQGRKILRYKRGESTWRSQRMGAATAIEWWLLLKVLTVVVRSTLPKVSAVAAERVRNEGRWLHRSPRPKMSLTTNVRWTDASVVFNPLVIRLR